MVQGEAGIKPLPQPLLEAIEAHQKQHDYLIGIDEIQTGLFRTGKFLNYEGKIARPDILTIGKGLSDMTCPIAAVLVQNNVLIAAEKTNIDYTSKIKNYYANALSSAISANALEWANAHDLATNATNMGNKIINALKKVEGKSLIKDVRGEGLLIGVELNADQFPLNLPFFKHYTAALFAACCLQNKKQAVLVAFTLNNPHTVRITPSLTITEEDTDKIIETVTEVARYSPWTLFLKSVLKI